MGPEGSAMRRLVLLLALFSVAATAKAAPPPAWASLSARETRVAGRIDQAARDGQISESEAVRLRRQLHKVEGLRAYYRKSHGMTAWERRDLERRLKSIDAHAGKRREHERATSKAVAAPPARSPPHRRGSPARP